MVWGNVIAGVVLFWPVVMILFFIAFCCIVFAVFLISGTFLIMSIFIYGLYCLLRDLGLIDWLIQKVGTLSNFVTTSVKRNVEHSFLFVQESQTLPSKPSLYLCHPHGLYGLTWFIHFSISLSNWPGAHRPVLAVHSIFFKLPILRELFHHNRCIEATEAEITRSLMEGNSVALLVGGIEELHATGTEPGVVHLVLNKRSGYARIAKQCDVPLVPLVCPNESDLFPPIQSPLWTTVQEFLYSTFHISIPLPSPSSLWSWITIAYKPFEKPLTTYILEPVLPDQRSIEDIKSDYRRRLETFSKHRSINLKIIQ